MKKSLLKNLLPFLPILIIYIGLIVFFSSDQLAGDESRHIRYATNLTNGYYTIDENPSLRNGPGYPLIITAPVLVGASYDFIRLLNIPLLFMALYFFHKTLTIYLKPIRITPIIYLLALYPPVLRSLIGILSESLALFLVCGFLYYFIQLFRQTSKKRLHLVLSASFLGFLALTKVIFGYVILSGIIFCFIAYLFKKTKKVQLGLFTLIGAFLLCIPYLGYTYSLTGKTFLWGTQGGEMLYWRSTPFENEYGDWISSDLVLGNVESNYCEVEAIAKNHGEFIEMLSPYSEVQKDSLFKQKGIENIKLYPFKYVKNTVASASRLFYNYPYSYKPFKISTFLYLIPNTFLVTFLILSLYLGIRNLKKLPFEIRLLSILALIFLGGITLLDGKARHLLPIIPMLVFCIIFVLKSTLKLNFKNELPNKLK